MAAFPEYFPEEDSLDQYVRQLADLMGLKDWKIILDDSGPSDDDVLGAVRVTYGRRRARIFLDEHDTIDELRNTIVHELLHIHLEPIDWQVNNLQTTLGDPMFNVWRGGFCDALEVAVDNIATAWAERLPLPRKVKKEAA